MELCHNIVLQNMLVLRMIRYDLFLRGLRPNGSIVVETSSFILPFVLMHAYLTITLERSRRLNQTYYAY